MRDLDICLLKPWLTDVRYNKMPVGSLFEVGGVVFNFHYTEHYLLRVLELLSRLNFDSFRYFGYWIILTINMEVLNNNTQTQYTGFIV